MAKKFSLKDMLKDAPDPEGEPDGDEPEPATDDGADDDSCVQCAHDLMDALDKGDAEGVAAAIKAIAESK